MAPKKSFLDNFDDGNLDLSLAEIKEVPVKDIAAISKLSSLDLSCNTIVSLPKTFATSLTRLVKLDLSKNQITALPENFGNLVNLKHLDLYNNQIQSLPLSFGNLKSLRWLDLKGNPMVPKLAEIAGLCQDMKQCQMAAKNVVATMRAMQDQVNDEIARRKEKQMKKLEDAAKNQPKENTQQKKKKKKNKNTAEGAVHANGKTSVVNEESEKGENKENGSVKSASKKKAAQKKSLLGKLVGLVSSVVRAMVVTILFVMFLGFLLSLFDRPLFESLQNKVERSIRTTLPKEYIQYWERGLKSSQQWKTQLVDMSIHLFNRAQEFYITFQNDERVLQFLETVSSWWHVIWIWLSEMSTTLSTEVPRYFAQIKSVISGPSQHAQPQV